MMHKAFMLYRLNSLEVVVTNTITMLILALHLCQCLAHAADAILRNLDPKSNFLLNP